MSTSTPNEQTPFGHQMLKHFLFSPENTNLNHGSFGAYPHPVRTKLHSLLDETESNPDLFLRYKKQSHLLTSRREIASLLHAPLNECVFIQNATGAVNTVLRNLVFERGDVIIFFATTYGPCEKGVASMVETVPGLEARKVGYEFPVAPGEIVGRFRDLVKECRREGLRVRLAMFETIVSCPGVRFPFERLVGVCREEGVLSLVDGAHAVGQIPLDLGELGADFFVTNLHKWLFTPRGTAIFHVPVRNQHLLRTTFPTSYGFVPNPPPHLLPVFSSGTSKGPASPSSAAQSPFETLFEQVATMDMSPYFCVPEAMKFRREVCGGEEKIYEYCIRIAREGGDKAAEILGTEVMQEEGVRAEDSGLRNCAFANLRLPIAVVSTAGGGEGRKEERERKMPLVTIEGGKAGVVAAWIEEKLVFEMGTFVVTYAHGGWLWCRVSGQVYVEVSNFEWLARGLKGICERVKAGEV